MKRLFIVPLLAIFLAFSGLVSVSSPAEAHSYRTCVAWYGDGGVGRVWYHNYMGNHAFYDVWVPDWYTWYYSYEGWSCSGLVHPW